MIIYKPGQDIFNSTAHFIVNLTNTKGTMGKGLAFEMKKRFPLNFKYYHNFCSLSSPKGGDLIFYYPENITKERPVINFCTKEQWQKPSKLEWIERGMSNLVERLSELYPDGQYPSPLVALPILGCGEGGIDKDKVLSVFKNVLVNVKFDVEIYN
jgi:O-acetyl-ADP-ribose deacetylase (regulator of RNase III)